MKVINSDINRLPKITIMYFILGKMSFSNELKETQNPII